MVRGSNLIIVYFKFSIMKTLKISLFALVSALFFFACEDPGPEVITDPPPPPPSNNFEAVFIGKNPTMTPYGVSECGSTFRHEFRGEGESDLLGSFTIVKRYCFEGDSPDKAATTYYYMTHGEFTLAAKGTVDTIVGTFDGDVSIGNGYSTLLEKFTITGGTGKYHNAMGYLSANISDSEELTGKISGRIRFESSPAASN